MEKQALIVFTQKNAVISRNNSLIICADNSQYQQSTEDIKNHLYLINNQNVRLFLTLSDEFSKLSDLMIVLLVQYCEKLFENIFQSSCAYALTKSYRRCLMSDILLG